MAKDDRKPGYALKMGYRMAKEKYESAKEGLKKRLTTKQPRKHGGIR